MNSPAADRASFTWKKLSWVPKLLLTAGAFYIVARQINVEQMQHMLREQDGGLLLVAASLALLQIIMGGIRWFFVLSRISKERFTAFRLPRGIRIFYISIFFNTCLPSTVGGDVVRVFLTKAEGAPLPQAINSVVIDRLLTLLALVLMMFLSLPYIGEKIGISASVVLPLMCVGTAFGLWLLVNLHRLPEKFLQTRIGSLLAHLADNVRQVLFQPRTLVLASSLAIISHLCYFFEAWVIAQSLHIEVSLTHMLLYMPLVMFVSILPISIGGWGVREASMVGLLALSGVSPESSVVLSVQMALLTMFILLPGGLIWLMQKKRIPLGEEGA